MIPFLQPRGISVSIKDMILCLLQTDIQFHTVCFKWQAPGEKQMGDK